LQSFVLNRHASTRKYMLVGMAMGFVFLSLYLLVPVVEELTQAQLLSEYIASYCKDIPLLVILNRSLCWASLLIGLVRALRKPAPLTVLPAPGLCVSSHLTHAP
jgi:Na+/phosphate symporter